MHNHPRVDGLSWSSKQPPNPSGLKQQWFTSCSHYMSKEGQGEALLVIVPKGSRLISPGHEQKAYWLSKFPLGNDTHHFHYNSLDNASHIVMLELKGSGKCNSTTFPGRGELEYFCTGVTSTMTWMTDRYLKAKAIPVIGSIPVVPQKRNLDVWLDFGDVW